MAVRFAGRGLDGLHDEPRPGKPRTISDEDIERVIVKTLEEQPRTAAHYLVTTHAFLSPARKGRVRRTLAAMTGRMLFVMRSMEPIGSAG